MRLLLAVFVAALVVAAVSSAAPPQYQITLDQASPSFGDQVTFTTSPDPVQNGWIQLSCYQAGVLVLAETHAAYSDGSAYGYKLPFTLGPTYRWAGGAADCTADLVIARKGSIYGVKPVASVGFQVAA